MTKGNRATKTVLLIEPNAILADQYMTYLAERGYKITVSHGAQEAIVAADKYSPDAVVMELVLSEHSGIEFLYEFRSYTEWLKVPVIILTRVPKVELGILDKAVKDLKISKILYKPETSLQKLADCLDLSIGKAESMTQ